MKYLINLNKNSRICLSKFRAGNNKLLIITGRHNQIDREERCCIKFVMLMQSRNAGLLKNVAQFSHVLLRIFR